MIRTTDLMLRVGSFMLDQVSLWVRPGEYFVLLGPSGSGKTLLLESICGLHRIHGGQIKIGGVDVTRREPRRRRLGYVPQDYALFPHLSVRHNAGFGLAGLPRLLSGACREEIQKCLEMVGLEHLADRRPGHLSGGEKQRVALARALATRPQVLLLDEPVSALDEQTRDELCRQLRKVQRNTGTTTLHVCHSFAEMLAVADRVAVIHQGRIVQVGEPHEVLNKPINLAVARFAQVRNLFPARAETAGEWLQLTGNDGARLRAAASGNTLHSGEVYWMVRPEDVRLRPVPADDAAVAEDLPPQTVRLAATVTDLVRLGPVVQVTVVTAEGTELLSLLGKKEYAACRVEPGQQVEALIDPGDVHVLAE